MMFYLNGCFHDAVCSVFNLHPFISELCVFTQPGQLMRNPGRGHLHTVLGFHSFGSCHAELIVENIEHIDGLVQDCSNSSALAMELLQSCTKPSILGHWPLGDLNEILK